MRIVLTHVGKEEISKEPNSYNAPNEQPNNMLVLNTDINTHNSIISRKPFNLNTKSKSLNKYKNNILFTENNKYNNRNSNSLLKAGLYSINNIYKPNNYKNPFNHYFKTNSKKSDLPLKIIALNNSVLTLPIEAKQIYGTDNDKEENKEKSQLIKINLSNNNINDNIKDENNNDNSFNNSRNLSLPKINIRNGLSLKNLLNSKSKRNIDDYLLKKEINKSDTNLINYLKLDKYIQPSFVKKINNANNEKLFKLDKICQKYFHDEEEVIILKNNIQHNIKKGFSKDAEFCKNELKNMNNALKGIENIYKGFQMKIDNIRDNKINYMKEIKSKMINKK